MAPALLWDAAELVVLSSAFLGRREAIAGYFGLEPDAVRAFASESPFALEQRLIEYRPVGALSKATLPELEPALFGEVAAILAAHPAEKGLVHAASYAAARRLLADLAARAPEQYRRVIFVESSEAKGRALDHHRASPQPTVLLSPSLREGVDLPDDFLRFQVITKVPYPDLGDPWTAARQARDPQWYALETAKALVQAYGRSCRHAGDHGVTYVLDAHFARFLQRYRPLLPAWFREAAEPAVRAAKARPLCAVALTRIGRASIMDARRGGRGMANALSAEIKTLLDRPNFAHLATLMPDGSPQSAPVWVTREGDRILVTRGMLRSRRGTRVATHAWRCPSPTWRTRTRRRSSADVWSNGGPTATSWPPTPPRASTRASHSLAESRWARGARDRGGQGSIYEAALHAHTAAIDAAAIWHTRRRP